MADSEFPEPRPGPSVEQLRLRLACTAGVAVVQIVVFWEFLLRSLPLLWPPTEPVTQWVTFLLFWAGSFLVVSGLFGTLIADQLYKRYLVDDRA
ncbi:MAG: hypothetical protein ACOC0Z_03980 [Halohasta sp.]